MDYLKIIIIFLMIWVLINLYSYKKLLLKLVQRLSPEEQRDLKENHEKLQEKHVLLEKEIDNKNFELKTLNEKNYSIERELESCSNENSKEQENAKLNKLELAKCYRVIEDNDKLLSEKDSRIRELQREVSAQTEAVKFAENKQSQHEPIIKYKQKKSYSKTSSCSGNSETSDWSTCRACGSNSPYLCRCSK